MKKSIKFGLFLLLGFSFFHFFSNSWDRSRFEGEVDSLLQVARDLTPKSAPDLILKKADQFGIILPEENIHFDVQEVGMATQSSGRLEKFGLKTITYQATLSFTYTQSFLGYQRVFSYSKNRNFTRSAEISRPEPPDFGEE